MNATAEQNRGLELARAGHIDEAAAIFRTLLETDPGNAAALHFFAVLAVRKSEMAEAEALLLRAIDARPGWAKAWDSLGKVYQARGRINEAEKAFKKATGIDPDNASHHRSYGLFLREAGRLPEAAAALTRATELEPQSPEAFEYLAAVLKDMSLDSEAETACRHAIDLAPGHAEARNILGIVQRKQGRYVDAEASYRQAIDLKPAFGIYHCNLANLLRDVGRFAEAETSYRRAIELDPSYTEAYRQLTDLTPVMNDDPLFSGMENLLESEALAPPRRVDLHFALAKALEDQKNYDAAFAHWQAGNSLKRSSIDYDDAAREAIAEQTIDVFDADLIARLAGQGHPSRAPIFIVGMPRSGTTLVEQILASHSAVQAGGELSALGRLAAAADYPSAFRNIEATALGRLGENYLDDAQPAGSERFTDKMPGNFLRIGMIRLILPNARIIHCRRDPVDTCLSCYRQLFTGTGQSYSYDQHELALEYRRYARLMEHWRSVAPETLYEIQYESLIENQEGEIRRLLAYCDLAFEENCLRFHETDRPVETASASQVRQPIYRRAQGRWKNYEAHLTPLLSALQP